MGKRVLIAEPREVVRAGLCTVFHQDASVSDVKDVATYEELQQHFAAFDTDLTIVSQMLITDVAVLPQGRFVILVDEPDLDVLVRTYEHQACGYLSINVTADLLHATLSCTKDMFLIDPVLLPWMMGLIIKDRKRTSELQILSPREREIAILLEEGLDRRTIAKQLCISDATLKTHIKNIAHKHEDAQWSQKVLAYRRHLKESRGESRRSAP